MSQKNAKRIRRLENRVDTKARRREENRMFLAIIFAFLAVFIMTMKVNAYMTGEPVMKQLYVAMHTSDTATVGEIQSVMQEADALWP